MCIRDSLWDLATGLDRFAVPDAHEQGVTQLLFAGGGKTLVAGSDGHTARVWDLTTGRQRSVLRHKGWVRSLDLSSDGRFLVSGLEYPGIVTLWDFATGLELWSWSAPSPFDPMVDIKFTNDNKKILSVWRDGSARGFDVLTGRVSDAVLPQLSIEKESAFADELFHAAEYSRDGTKLAISGPGGDGVYVVEAATGKPLFQEKARTFHFSPDGKTLLLTSNARTMVRLVDGRSRASVTDGVARLLDASNGQSRLEFKRPGSMFGPGAISPDGTLVAIAMTVGKQPMIGLFDATVGRERAILRGLDSQVTSLAFTPDGRGLVSGLTDTTVLVWDVPATR